jgi:hypothetical protein
MLRYSKHGGFIVSRIFYSPDYAPLVDPLLRKEGERKKKTKNPSFRAAKRGWSGEAMTG